MAKLKSAPKLIEELAHKDAAIRRKAAHKLGQKAAAAALLPLMMALDDQDVYVRRRVIEALGSLENAAAFDALLPFLKDQPPGVRRITALSLGEICYAHPHLAASAVPAIVHAATIDRENQRIQYLEALLTMRSAAVTPLCLEYNSRRSEAHLECARQALAAMQFQHQWDAARCLLESPDLTAPQQWTVLEMLSEECPTGLFANRRLANPRRYVEQVATSTQESEAARRHARAILEYLSLGRASQRQEPTDAAQLLRMAQADSTSDRDGDTLLRGSQAEETCVQEENLLAKLRRWLSG